MRGAGFLAIWSDVEGAHLTDYRHWLTREHTTERVTTKGFLASRVFRAVRGGGVVKARAGRGEGSTIVALRVEHLPETPGRLADDIAALDGIAAVQIGATDLARTSVPTVEKGMRQHEGIFAGLLLIEALDEKSLRSALRRAAEIAPDVVGDAGNPEIYQSIFALDARIAWIE